MDPRLVAVHSPDVCWIAAGWKQAGPPSHWTPITSSGRGLGVGERRTFIDGGGVVQNVVFWHLVGGEPSGYMGRAFRNESFWSWDKIFRNPRAAIYEQWFIRVSTPGGLEDLQNDPLWGEILNKLSAAAKPPHSLPSKE